MMKITDFEKVIEIHSILNAQIDKKGISWFNAEQNIVLQFDAVKYQLVDEGYTETEAVEILRIACRLNEVVRKENLILLEEIECKISINRFKRK